MLFKLLSLKCVRVCYLSGTVGGHEPWRMWCKGRHFYFPEERSQGEHSEVKGHWANIHEVKALEANVHEANVH